MVRLRDPERLRASLDRLYNSFNYPDSATDPIQIVRRFKRSDDREVIGFCAAALAFGRVTSVLQSIERLLAVMGSSPAAYVRQFDPRTDTQALDGFVHRWTRGLDVAALLWILRQILEQSGTIEEFFLEGHPSDAEDVELALGRFSTRALDLDVSAVYGDVIARPGVAYFFPRPLAGSGCKRLNLFLRWMVRNDELDLGVWSRLPPSALIVPLDTHVIRVGRCLRLTRYSSPGWSMACEITSSMRQLDPRDPVKYDFALCHLGMMNACSFNRGAQDVQCPLRGVCQPRWRTPRRLRRSSSGR